MKCNIVRTTFFVTPLLALATIAPAQNGGACSNARVAGTWGYTYTGTLILPSGGVPTASVGRFTLDAAGNFSGTQASSLGGNVGKDTLKGSADVMSDCTGTLTLYIYDQSGNLLRTAVLAFVVVDNAKEIRGIFTSLVLPIGEARAVITVKAIRI
jgi:hypothetical protein